MIIFIKKIDNVENLSSSQERALEVLLCTYGRGTHVLWMPINIIDSLIKLTCFSNYAKRALIDLKTFSSFSKNTLESEFSFKVIIDFNDRTRFQLSDNELHVGYEKTLDEKFLLQPIVLTENEIDARVYAHFANAFLSARRNLTSSFEIAIDPQGGGGADTIKKFKRYLGEGRIFICLIDSDKKHPKGNFGSTSRHFNCYQKGLNDGYYLEVIDCHEIENLIPAKLVNDLYPTSDTGLVYKDPKFISFRKYPDHKNGLSVQEAKRQDLKYKDEYWKSFYSYNESTNICGKFSNLLEKAHSYLEKTTPQKVYEVLDHDLDYDLHNISLIISEWGVKLKRTLS